LIKKVGKCGFEIDGIVCGSKSMDLVYDLYDWHSYFRRINDHIEETSISHY
jgi:hypothetical protein